MDEIFEVYKVYNVVKPRSNNRETAAVGKKKPTILRVHHVKKGDVADGRETIESTD
jgi:hypothetical protein